MQNRTAVLVKVSLLAASIRDEFVTGLNCLILILFEFVKCKKYHQVVVCHVYCILKTSYFCRAVLFFLLCSCVNNLKKYQITLFYSECGRKSKQSAAKGVCNNQGLFFLAIHMNLTSHNQATDTM